MRARSLLPFLCGIVAACTLPPAAARLTQRGDVVEAALDGPFASYRTTGARRPVVFPLCTDSGVPVTRTFPFAEVAGEAKDHPHHESLWFAHGAVNGVDFWQGDGRIDEVSSELTVADGAVHGVSVWRDGKGREVCRDHHTIRFCGGERWRAVDVDLTVLASNGELRFGDTKEGTFAVRLRPELCLTGPGATATLVDSEGRDGAAVWGKRARWVAYTGTVQGELVTVAMFDHPGNPSYPTWWHARDYGLCAANPFGVHDFAGGPPGTGDRVVPAGGQLRWRHRVFVATGAAWRDAIEFAFCDWLAEDGRRR